MLEARFHPQRRTQPAFEIVGYLVWEKGEPGARPVFEPSRPIVPAGVISKIHYFVGITAPDCFDGLQALGSEFWSFVPINADQAHAETISRTQ